MRKTFNRRKDWFSEAKNDKNVNNKYKFVKENYGSKYCPKVSPIKKTVLNNVNKFNKFGSVTNLLKNTLQKSEKYFRQWFG
jgi:hypothetical protein